jgi:hypothetical protein
LSPGDHRTAANVVLLLCCKARLLCVCVWARGGGAVSAFQGTQFMRACNCPHCNAPLSAGR